MRVWLLQISEPLPMDGPQVRLLRTAVLAERLLARGHEVVWWSGAFDHINKRHRVRRSVKVPLWDRGEVYLLASCGYRKNVSLWRIVDHFQVAREFAKLAPREPAPDIIVASLPSQDFCAAGAEYAAKRGIPLIVDLRDQWPDVFLELFPKWLRKVGRFLLRPFFAQTLRACRQAAGLVGVTPELLCWGLTYAGRVQSQRDRVFILGYQPRKYSESVLEEGKDFWDRHGVRAGSEDLTICFFGTMSQQFILEPVVETARILETEGISVRWILCGGGDALERLRYRAKALRSVFLPGWVDGIQIQSLMKRADVGLAPYPQTPNFYGAFPNKIGEYLSGGLPILSTLIGGVDELLERYQCGWNYEPTNVGGLASLVKQIIHQRDELSRMSMRAKKLFADYFDAEKIYPAYVEYIEEAAKIGRVHRQAA
ncbi:MAG TPA: glycosyltransferase family 4 protein [Thermoguttaceae bacterium]|nr:glycosyltransferase family 4 protein [Thermoguttaceae bacterium]